MSYMTSMTSYFPYSRQSYYKNYQAYFFLAHPVYATEYFNISNEHDLIVQCVFVFAFSVSHYSFSVRFILWAVMPDSNKLID